MDTSELTDLASARLGGRALAANDEFFAARSNLLLPHEPVFIPGKFTARGKWMDGWETRRRRTPGHDWCVIRLGLRGVVHAADVDTRFFNGNQPEQASIEGCDLARGTAPGPRTRWTELLAKTPLRPSAHNLVEVAGVGPLTHVRLNIHPDGGVARLRVLGVVEVDWTRRAGRRVDLAAVANGGKVLAASDEHFGSKDHLILPGRAPNMGDGWETRRRRGPGHDWLILRLGARGSIERIEVDTNHFKGNYPESCSLEGADAAGATIESLRAESFAWRDVLPRTRLRAHHRHFFRPPEKGPFTHVRFRIFPDGGVSRLRLHGRVVAP